MEKVLLLILALLLAGCAALVHWGPVTGYVIECERMSSVTCDLERSKAAGKNGWRIQFGPDVTAKVEVVSRRRGGPDVYLYLRSSDRDVFAAQFGSHDRIAEAEAAARQLNQTFQSDVRSKARIEIHAPAFFRWLSWSGLGVMALLIVAIYRELRSLQQLSA